MQTDLLFVLKNARQLLVDGSEALAVSTPGSVELDQDVILLVKDDLVKVGGSQINDEAGGGSRDSGLQA